MPGARTVWSGNSGICMACGAYGVIRHGRRRRIASLRQPVQHGTLGRGRAAPQERTRTNAAGDPGGVVRRLERAPSGAVRRGQWEQDRGEPASSPVRKLEPQPQPETAFGLLTVKPAPISVST